MCENGKEINYKEDSIAYILNLTWNKPREIARFLITAIIKTYSQKCLDETQEEMRAIYSNDQIGEIIQCFKGFRVRFTLEELEYHINKNYINDQTLKNIKSILHDSYRLGIVGNYSGLSKSYHWQHKGDTGLLFTDEWEMQIHRSLWGALQISKRHDESTKKIPDEAIEYEGKKVDVLVNEIEEKCARVSFDIGGISQNGIIFKKNISTEFVYRISDYIQSGITIEAQIIEYNKMHGKWELTMNY